jgi:hypothetical protein
MISTKLLEKCRGFKKHIIEEIVSQVGHLPEKRKHTHKFCTVILMFTIVFRSFNFPQAEIMIIRNFELKQLRPSSAFHSAVKQKKNKLGGRYEWFNTDFCIQLTLQSFLLAKQMQ